MTAILVLASVISLGLPVSSSSDLSSSAHNLLGDASITERAGPGSVVGRVDEALKMLQDRGYYGI